MAMLYGGNQIQFPDGSTQSSAPTPDVIGIGASIAANAITISSGELNLNFRNTTLTNGSVTRVRGTPANLVIAATDSFGLATANGNQRIAILAFNDAGVIRLAASAIYGGVQLDETNLLSTTTTATTATAIECGTVLSSKAYRVIGYIEATFTTAVGWGSLVTVQGAGGQALTASASNVSYTPAGIGAVTTTVQTKLRESVSVKDFGAVGDGVTDDTAAIQAAIDASAGIWIDGGGANYAIGTSLIAKTNTLITNATLTLIGGNSAYGVAAIYNENWNSTTGNTGIKLDNIAIVGINTTQQSDATVITSANKGIGGVYLGYVANSQVTNCNVQDSWSGIVITQAPSGVNLYQANNLIENCKVTRAQAWSQTGNSGRPRGILFLSGGLVTNSESLSSATGFYFGNTSGATMDSCRAYNWFIDDGFYILGNDLRVTNCLAYGNNFGSGFAVAYNERSYIAGNTAVNCGNMGFRVHVPQSRTQFIGNTATRCGYGFRVDTTSHPYPEMCDGLVIQGNIAEYSDLVGFQFQQIKNSIITGNIARNNNKTGIVLTTRGGIALFAYAIQNRVSDNHCYDDQGTPTQTWGLYVYSAVDSGASVENTGNSIDHKSITGTDYFGLLAADVGRGFTEMGAWTPTVSFTTTSGTQTYSARVGRYLKVGNMVTLFATITLTAKDAAAAGNLRITGIPAALIPVTLASYLAIGHCMAASLNFDAGYTQTNCYLQSNDSSIYVWESGDNVALSQIDAAQVNNNTSLYITITYQTA